MANVSVFSTENNEHFGLEHTGATDHNQTREISSVHTQATATRQNIDKHLSCYYHLTSTLECFSSVFLK